MARLFNRVWRLQLGELVTEDLDISFKITRHLGATPGTAEIEVYNLSETHRRAFRPSPSGWLRVFCQLDAGFEGSRSMLFRGDTRRVLSARDDVKWTTTVTAGDGEHAIRKARVVAAFARETPLVIVVRELAQQMGIGEGNLASVTEALGASARAGTVLHGAAAQELTRLCDQSGLEWSVQDGVLQFLRRGRGLERQAITLDSETGLIGNIERAGWRRIKLKALLQPDLVPGRKIVVDSSTAQGEYRITHVEYHGETRGADWHAEITAREIALDASLIV